MLLVHGESRAGHVGATPFQEMLAKALALPVKVGARKRLIAENTHLYEA
jgi:hypothetical protein